MNNIVSVDRANETIKKHNELFWEIKSNSIWSQKWQEYIEEKKREKEFYFFDEKFFQDIQTTYNVIFPEDIKYFYSHIGSPKSDLTNSLNLFKDATKYHFNFHIFLSESFAKVIIDEFEGLGINKKKELKLELSVIYDWEEVYSDELELMLCEVNTYYDFQTNSFKIDFLQNLYTQFAYTDPIYKALHTWCHCGGCGILFLNGNRKSFMNVFTWGSTMPLEYNERIYNYSGFQNDNLKEHFFLFENHNQIIYEEITMMKRIINGENMKEQTFSENQSKNTYQVDINGRIISPISNFEEKNNKPDEQILSTDIIKIIVLIMIFLIAIFKFISVMI